MYNMYNTVVFRVSGLGHLNMTSDFALHGLQIAHIYIETATLTLMQCMDACMGVGLARDSMVVANNNLMTYLFHVDFKGT